MQQIHYWGEIRCASDGALGTQNGYMGHEGVRQLFLKISGIKKYGSNSDTGQLYMNGHFYYRYLKKEKSYSNIQADKT